METFSAHSDDSGRGKGLGMGGDRNRTFLTWARTRTADGRGVRSLVSGLAALVCMVLGSEGVLGQVGADGIDWATIGAPGNRAYDGPDPFNLVSGRGSVGYEYRLSRTEITTSQWLGFFNAALARPDPLPFVNTVWWSTPIIWGAERDTSYTGPGTRYRLRTDVPNAGMLPVGGISWRQAAILCNWYESGRASTPSSFTGGVYNVSTFTPGNAFPTFNDQPTHNPGSHYWIPNLDEWMKAVHYDPNGNGPGQGRWWQQPNGTDTPLIYGPPPTFGGDGTGQANSGFVLTANAQYQIPLGSYPSVLTPWGLLDAAGATTEWLETIRTVDDIMTRGLDGSDWAAEASGADLVYSWGSNSPSNRLTFTGFRMASSTVPAPASALVFLTFCGVFSRGRRPHHATVQDDPRVGQRFCSVG